MKRGHKLLEKSDAKALLIGIIGSVIGVVLTFGVTYCSDRNDKREMAEKTVRLTIHNLDASINSMDRLIAELESQDSIFRYVRGRRDSVDKISADTLALFISGLYSRRVRPIDTSAERIFTNNFEIWRYLDDPKVIGRIANCYSIMESCNAEFERIEREKYEAFTRCYDDLEGTHDDRRLASILLNRNDIDRVTEGLPEVIAFMRHLLDTARTLNDRNKTELDLGQRELDEMGHLL